MQLLSSVANLCASMMGFKSFRSAAITLAGIELAHQIRKRQFSFGRQRRARSLKELWIALCLGIPYAIRRNGSFCVAAYAPEPNLSGASFFLIINILCAFRTLFVGPKRTRSSATQHRGLVQQARTQLVQHTAPSPPARQTLSFWLTQTANKGLALHRTHCS